MLIDRYIGRTVDSLKRDEAALVDALREIDPNKNLRIKRRELSGF